MAEHDGSGDSQNVRASQLGANLNAPMLGSSLVRNVPHHPACGSRMAVSTFHASRAATIVRAIGVRRNAGYQHQTAGSSRPIAMASKGRSNGAPSNGPRNGLGHATTGTKRKPQSRPAPD